MFGVSWHMRYLVIAILSVLLCLQGAANAELEHAKVHVHTKVYSVAGDGSVQLLRPSPSSVLDSSTLQDISARILTPNSDPAKGLATATNDIVAGDVLRYEITVSNETDFVVPALALNIYEEIATGAALMGYSQEQQERWRIELVDNPASLNSDAVRRITNPSATLGTGSSGQRLRLQNLKPLRIGGQLEFAYDVTVRKSQRGEQRTP